MHPVSPLTIGPVAFGTMTFGSRVTHQDHATRMVNACREAGVTHFDTANTYNAGASERMLGAALEHRRDQVTIATKVRQAVGDEPGGLRPDQIRRAVEDSLERLATDFTDLYYLHQPDYDVPIADTLGAMTELVVAGKVGEIGVSNYAAWQIADIHAMASDQGWPRVRIAQQMYNLTARSLDHEYARFAETHQMVTVAYNPLAAGLLTGRYQLDDEPAPGTRFTNATYRRRYWHPRQFAAVDGLSAIARDAGMTLTTLALRWMRSQPIVDVVLIGASTDEQLAQNLKAVHESPLPRDVLEACDAVWDELKGPVPRYNR